MMDNYAWKFISLNVYNYYVCLFCIAISCLVEYEIGDDDILQILSF